MKHFILGPKASVFHDASTGLLVTSQEKPTAYAGSVSKRMEIAIQHGHIKEVPAPAGADSAPKGATSDITLEEMDDKQLLAYYKENFDVTADDAKAFKAMSKEDKIKFLQE